MYEWTIEAVGLERDGTGRELTMGSKEDGVCSILRYDVSRNITVLRDVMGMAPLPTR